MNTVSTHLILSDLVADFLKQAPTFSDVFQHTSITDEFCELKARQGAPRSRIKSLLSAGLRGTFLSDLQHRNIELILDDKSVVVCGGQQLGMFGGPLYTLLKLRTIVEESQRISSKHNVPVVPVFWLEDVDHDAAEAASTYLMKAPATDGPPAVSKAEQFNIWDGTTPRLPVFKRRFSSTEVATIISVAGNFQGQHADEVRRLIDQTYKEGTTWSDAFLAVLQPFLQAWGVTVVRASDVLLYGMHAPFCIRDSDLPDELYQTIEKQSKLLDSLGYHRQANVTSYQFMYETEQGRMRIEPADGGVTIDGEFKTHAWLVEQARMHPQKFSPGVLARPLIQDALLPTVGNVLGAAEIAYHAQLSTAYSLFGIAQPVPILRRSLCIIDLKTERNISKVGKRAEWFFRPLSELIADIAKELANDVVPSASERTQAIQDLVSPFQKSAEHIDSALQHKIAAAQTAILQQLQNLESKLKGSLKKSNATTIQRIESAWWSLFPNGSLQERTYPLLHYVLGVGIETVRIIVEEACKVDPGKLAVIPVSSTNISRMDKKL